MPQHGIKFRAYPTEPQQQSLTKVFGCVRYVWNRALAYRKATYAYTGTGATYCNTSKALTRWKREQPTAWLKEPSKGPLQQSLRDLDQSYSRFFQGLKNGQKAGFPKFKRRNSKQSATYDRNCFKFDRENGRVYLAKLGWVKIRGSRDIRVGPSSVTITKTPTGKYVVSFKVNQVVEAKSFSTDSVGVDVGIAETAITSDGVFFHNERHTKRYARRLRMAQKEMSRRTKGTGRWHRSRLKVARIHEKIANCRTDRTHKITTQLIDENQVIAIEDLRVSNMLQNKRLAKHIADSNWYEFRRQLEYKSNWYGKTLVVVPARNTSRQCAKCGHVAADNRQTQPAFCCVKCGHEANADVNAAQNILAAGLAVLARGESVSRGEASSSSRSSQRNVNQPEAKI